MSRGSKMKSGSLGIRIKWETFFQTVSSLTPKQFLKLYLVCGVTLVAVFIIYGERPSTRTPAVHRQVYHFTNLTSPKSLVCTDERKHIYYIKLHKTGSGTLSNMFLRFGVKRNLTFAIPKEGSQFDGGPLDESMIRPAPGGRKYEMLVLHAVYSSPVKARSFAADTVTIASFREPFSLFMSSYRFFHYKSFLPTSKSNQSEDNEIERFLRYAYDESQSRGEAAGTFSMNRLSYRLGIPLSLSRDRQFVTVYTELMLMKTIDLVTLQEYFDESLVLLKRKLCWETEDIIYLPLHVRSTQSHQDPNISTKSRLLFEELTVGEHIIYKHFYRFFWKLMWTEGHEIFDEVREYKQVLRIVQEFCRSKPKDWNSVEIPASRWSRGFKVSGMTCRQMLMRNADGIAWILRTMKKSAT